MARISNARPDSPPTPDALATPHTLAMKTPLPGAIIQTDTPTSALVSKRKRIWDAIANDKKFDGFACTIVPPDPKRQKTAPKQKKQGKSSQSQSPAASDNPKKTSLDANNVVQPNPFPNTKLAETRYSVSPPVPWEYTTAYRVATIGKHDFKINQYVFVENTDEPSIDSIAINFWIARILEIRAGNKRHVYLRVYWMYRPEDLPGGRQPHHGECELIASNHMDIIEVANVHGPADVYHWKEDANDESIGWPAEDQLFWRQTFDVTKYPGKSGQGQFSKLPTYCIDNAPSYPDEPFVQCDSCLEWLHASCLEAQAVQEAEAAPKSRGRPKKGPAGKPVYSAKLQESSRGKIRLTLTTQLRNQPAQETDVDINCLMCNKPIASERLPDETNAIADIEPALTTGDTSETEDVITVDLSDADAMESEPESDDALDAEPASSATTSSADEDEAADEAADEDDEENAEQAAVPGLEQVPDLASPESKKRKRTSQAHTTPLAEIHQNESILASGARSIKRLLAFR